MPENTLMDKLVAGFDEMYRSMQSQIKDLEREADYVLGRMIHYP